MESQSGFSPTAGSHRILQNHGRETVVRKGPGPKRLCPPGSPPALIATERPVHRDSHRRQVHNLTPPSRALKRFPPPKASSHSEVTQPLSSWAAIVAHERTLATLACWSGLGMLTRLVDTRVAQPTRVCSSIIEHHITSAPIHHLKCPS